MKIIDYDNLILSENIFGLEIVNNTIKVLELKRSRGRYSVVGFGQQNIDPKCFSDGVILNKEAVADAIRLARVEAKPRRIRTKYASVALPESKIFVRVIKFPAGMTKEEIREAVEWKAKDFIAMPLDKVYWDWHRLTPEDGKDGGEVEVVVSAVEKECADSLTETLKLLNITPLYYDIAGNAAARFLFQKEYSEKKALLVRIDKNSTTLSLFLNGGVRYQTIIKDVIKGGYGVLVDYVASQLKIDAEKAEKLILSPENLDNQQKSLLVEFFGAKFDHLMVEIRQITDFYKQSLLGNTDKELTKEPFEIYLYGKGARVFHLAEHFEKQSLKVSTDVKASTPVSPIVQFISRQSLLENLVLLGLSLRNLGLFRELRDINLVPKIIKIKYLQVSIYNNVYASLRIVFWNTFVIVVVLAFVNMIAVIYKANIERDLKAVENVAESPANKEIQSEIVYLNQTAGQMSRLFETQLDWDKFFQEVSNLRGNGITYTDLLVSEDQEVWKALSGEKKSVVKAGHDYVVISGIAQTRDDLQRFVEDIRESEIFKDIKMPISNFETSVNIEFVIYGLVDTSKVKQLDE